MRSVRRRVLRTVALSAAAAVILAGCAKPIPESTQVSARATRMVEAILGANADADIQAGDPTVIDCPEVTREGRIAFEVPISVDGVAKPPMRVSYDHGRWVNLNGGCDCHRPPGADFENSEPPGGPGLRL